MKKFISLVLVSLFISSLFPGRVFAKHPAGSNVKDPSGVIYFISQDGTRRAYTSAGAFLSYGFNNWKSVLTADSDDLNLPIGSFITPQDGKIICADRGGQKGTCYLISSGMKRAFVSAKVFTDQGFSFKRALSGDVSFLGETSAITDSGVAHSPGVLIKKGNTIYLVTENGLFGIPNNEIFSSWGFSYEDVVPFNSNDGGQYFSVVGNLEYRKPTDLSPIPSAFNNVAPTNNTAGYLQANLSYKSPSGNLNPGAKNVEIFRATITAPSNGSVIITQLNLTFGDESSPAPISNIRLTNAATGEEVGSFSGTLQYNSVGFGLSSSAILSYGASYELVVTADISDKAQGSSFDVRLTDIWTKGPDGNSNLASAYSLPVVGNRLTVKPSVAIGPVTAPTSSTILRSGQTTTITWQTTNATSADTVDIYAVAVKKGCQIAKAADIYNCYSYSSTSRNAVVNVAKSAPDTGSYSWTVPGDWQSSYDTAVIYMGLVNDYNSYIISQPFSIISTAPSIKILSPSGGEVFTSGSTMPISWTTTNMPTSQNIRDVYLKDSSGQEIYITSDLPNTGSAQIPLPKNLTDDSYILELKTVFGGILIVGTSDSPFSISANVYSSRDKKRLADIRQLASALELYFNDNSKYPNSLSTMAPTYIGQIPSAPSPADGSCSYYQNLYSYLPSNNGSGYTLSFCLGGATGGYSAGPRMLSPSGIQ